MEHEFTADEIRNARFPKALRGLDPEAVAAFLDRLASDIEELREQRNRLKERLGELAQRDLAAEFEDVGKEVTAVLQAAREAAEAMRERARQDAGRWRSEAMAEAESLLKEARSDAEALRGDAWTTGTELLYQARAQVRSMKEEAERDVLTILGEAEREAHRLTSTARREAEDLSRAARMEAERLNSEATKRHNEIIEQAHRAAEAAQERTRALEERREELLQELETVRSTLGRLEGALEERRDLGLLTDASSSVRVVPTRAEPGSDWEPGETVRIVRAQPKTDEEEESEEPSEAAEATEETPTADQMAEEVARLRESRRPERPVSGDEFAFVPERDGVSPETDGGEQPADDVGGLFARLRAFTPEEQPDESPVAVTPSPETVAARRATPPMTAAAIRVPIAPEEDLFRRREAALLPITNRALRGVKKSVTDAQNVALDGLRTDEKQWRVDKSAMTETIRADLIGLWAESFAAGHAVAFDLIGSKPKRPQTPHTDAPELFGADLAAAVTQAVASAGDGQRDRQAAASRVFRTWRTDEVERRIRELALLGYHRGIIDTGGDIEVVWVPAGRPCSACVAAAETPATNPPPVHSGCECTVAPAG